MIFIVFPWWSGVKMPLTYVASVKSPNLAYLFSLSMIDQFLHLNLPPQINSTQL